MEGRREERKCEEKNMFTNSVNMMYGSLVRETSVLVTGEKNGEKERRMEGRREEWKEGKKEKQR